MLLSVPAAAAIAIAAGAGANTGASATIATASAMAAGVPKDGMVTNTLEIAGPQNEAAEIILKSGDNAYSLGARPDGSFSITDGDEHAFLSVRDGNVFAHAQTLAAGGISSGENIAVGNEMQYALAIAEDFAVGSSGWGVECPNLCPGTEAAGDQTCLEGSVTPCGGIRMLGGFRTYGPGRTSKTFSGLRSHTHVRVTGNIHFIDEWEGETVYVMLGSKIMGRGCTEAQYAFTHSFDTREVSSGINVCGDAVPEGRFSVPFDLVVPHKGSELEVIFGSTLKPKTQFDKHGKAWWGVSGLEILTR